MKAMTIAKGIDWKRLTVKIVTVIIGGAAFTWLHRQGMSPVLAALAILFLRTLFRFLFRIMCCLMTLVVLIGVIVFLLS